MDHEGQRSQLQELADAGRAALRVSDCLGRCVEGNVVVVRPATGARLKGVRPVWLGCVDDATFPLLTDWIGAGGPGRVPLPDALHSRVVPPQRH